MKSSTLLLALCILFLVLQSEASRFPLTWPTAPPGYARKRVIEQNDRVEPNLRDGEIRSRRRFDGAPDDIYHIPFTLPKGGKRDNTQDRYSSYLQE